MFLWKLNRRCTCVKKNIHLSNLRQSFNYVKSFNVSEHSYYNWCTTLISLTDMSLSDNENVHANI